MRLFVGWNFSYVCGKDLYYKQTLFCFVNNIFGLTFQESCQKFQINFLG